MPKDPEQVGTGRRRRPTATSAFGVGKREAHDSSAFYARFTPPEISDDDVVAPFPALDDPLILGDSRDMHQVPDGSVALVVTSPPYFVGKDYENDIQRAEVPASYAEYLEMLRGVFAECKRVLEPGGRIAVNVANLGRKPYRSLSADVIGILQDDLGMLLRGEVIWQKAQGSTGSCAWGTFKNAHNPVLRDLTERVIIASKGRLDRARTRAQREAEGLPYRNFVSNDEYLAATLDVWDIPAESAKRVGHPAPFPADLAKRLVHLYTYEDDVVLDPFLGSGSTAVAAKRWRRRYVGYDLDPDYLALARARVDATEPIAFDLDDARADLGHDGDGDRGDGDDRSAVVDAGTDADEDDDHVQARATREGKGAQDLAAEVLEAAGFTVLPRRNVRLSRLGLAIGLQAHDARGRIWHFDVTGAYTISRGGLARTDAVWRALGRAAVLSANGYRAYTGDRDADARAGTEGPYVLLTSHLPRAGSDGLKALHRAGPDAFFDAVAMLSDDGRIRLRAYATGEVHRPLVGFWSDAELHADHDRG